MILSRNRIRVWTRDRGPYRKRPRSQPYQPDLRNSSLDCVHTPRFASHPGSSDSQRARFTVETEQPLQKLVSLFQAAARGWMPAIRRNSRFSVSCQSLSQEATRLTTQCRSEIIPDPRPRQFNCEKAICPGRWGGIPFQDSHVTKVHVVYAGVPSQLVAVDAAPNFSGRNRAFTYAQFDQIRQQPAGLLRRACLRRHAAQPGPRRRVTIRRGIVRDRELIRPAWSRSAPRQRLHGCGRPARLHGPGRCPQLRVLVTGVWRKYSRSRPGDQP